MFFKYGSFQHTANEVTLSSFTQRPVRNSRGDITSTIKTMRIQGVLIADGQPAIQTKIEALEAAYDRNNLDAGLYQDDGTVTPHFLDTSASMDGVRVISLDYDRADRAEYATGRGYSIALEAEFIGSVGLVAFQETLRFVGTGGRRLIAIETLTGPPQMQITNQRTRQTVVQSGNAVGLRSYPFFPPPIFSSNEDQSRRTQTNGPPQVRKNVFINWPISWSYFFVLPSGQSGQPHRR